jgi:hypothetical protein
MTSAILGNANGKYVTLQNPDTNMEDVIVDTSKIMQKVASTDNAIVRFKGLTGEVQNSGVVVDDNNNIHSTTSSGNSAIVRDVSTSGAGNYIRFKNIADNDTSYVYSLGAMLKLAQASDTTDSKITFATMDIERLTLDSAGNLLLTSVTGAIGYGSGTGAQVVQLINKNNAVTLNKSNGIINLSNSALPAGVTTVFQVNNSLVQQTDIILLSIGGSYTANYSIWSTFGNDGSFNIFVKNITDLTLSEDIAIKFLVIKGSNS